jgi:hypothetical protein
MAGRRHDNEAHKPTVLLFKPHYALSASSLSTSLAAGLEGLLGAAGNGGGTLGLEKGKRESVRESEE